MEMLFNSSIGSNIRKTRIERGYSQQVLGEKCGIANTMISNYENEKKNPDLITLGKIAKALNTTIDQLYYGDNTVSFISKEANEGRRIVNAVYYLWVENVISAKEIHSSIPGPSNPPKGFFLSLKKHEEPIKRLLIELETYKKKEQTYTEPEKYLEILFDSVAKEINTEIEKHPKNSKTGF